MTDLTRRVREFVESETADDDAFEALALEVFAHQYESIELVRALADRAGRGPDRVDGWRQIPAMPTAAFKETELLSDAAGPLARVFESSGTSGANRSRSLFSEEGLGLMDAAIRANASRALFPDGRATRIFVLAPPPQAAPTMIMAWGMERLIEHFGLDGSGFFVGRDGLDSAGLDRALRAATADGVPVTLIGASFGFVHLLDALAQRGTRYHCAPHSRLMDAGGFKGRSRAVTREWLHQKIEERFEIPETRCVNLLGMTELASQLYDSTIASPTTPRRKMNPHWTRTRVLDPGTLQPIALGEVGLLQHLDLANVERPMLIQTDDLGRADEHGWEVLGRAEGSEARGCSLSIDELVDSRIVPLNRARKPTR